MWRVLFKLGVGLLLILGILAIAYKVEQVRPDYDAQEYLYLSKFKGIRRFALGFEAEYADFLWIQSLQGFHKRIFKKVPFKQIFEVYDVITDLDPNFKEAYITGSLYISISKKSPMSGIKILEEGTQKIPQEPWIWIKLGRMYWLERFSLENTKELGREEATKRAIKYISHGYTLSKGKLGGETLRFLALYDKFSTFDTLSWLAIYEQANKNKLLKSMALTRLQEHLIRLQLQRIKNFLHKFYKKHKRWPTKLTKLPISIPNEPLQKDMPQIAKNILAFLKGNPAKGSGIKLALYQYIQHNLKSTGPSYIYNKNTGEVLSYSQEENKIPLQIQKLQLWVNRFHHFKKRLPKNLQEVKKRFRLKKFPKLPSWRKFSYDPTTGIVSVNSKK